MCALNVSIRLILTFRFLDGIILSAEIKLIMYDDATIFFEKIFEKNWPTFSHRIIGRAPLALRVICNKTQAGIGLVFHPR